MAGSPIYVISIDKLYDPPAPAIRMQPDLILVTPLEKVLR